MTAHDLAKNKIPLILVSQTSPVRPGDNRLNDCTSSGSPAISSFIEQWRPDLCICGQVGTTAGKNRIGRIPACNAACSGTAAGWKLIV